MSTTPYAQLEQEWRRLHAFRGALALLRWDAAVMMPRGGAEVRGEQLAALETEHHALLTAPRITRLLDRAQANAQGLEDWQLANLREMRRQRDHAIATPVSLISRLAPPAAKGAAMGIYNTTQSIGVAMGGIVGGWLAKHFGGMSVHGFCVALGAVWLALAATMTPPPVRRPASAT